MIDITTRRIHGSRMVGPPPTNCYLHGCPERGESPALPAVTCATPIEPDMNRNIVLITINKSTGHRQGPFAAASGEGSKREKNLWKGLFFGSSIILNHVTPPDIGFTSVMRPLTHFAPLHRSIY